MKIGVYLAYPPRVKLSAQGLGRYLQYLVNALVQNNGVSIVILTPSWLKGEISQFLNEQGAPLDRVRFLAPPHKPLAIKLFDLIDKWRNQQAEREGFVQRIKGRFLRLSHVIRTHAFGYLSFLANSRTSPQFIFAILSGLFVSAFVGMVALFLALLVTPFYLAIAIVRRLRKTSKSLIVLKGAERNFSIFHDLRRVASLPAFSKLYDEINKKESELMISLANQERCDVWYSPTAFWPEVANINGKVVVCVPDLSPSDFPVHYAIKYPHVVSTVEKILLTIKNSMYFIAYGESVARKTLVHDLCVPSENVFVVPHAPSDLDRHINIEGTLDPVHAKWKFATSLIEGFRAVNFQKDQYLASFSFADTKYIFYPTQIRPNKNILNLLQAYEILLRKKYRYVKLFLTGSLEEDKDVRDFLMSRRLNFEVIAFNNVPEQVLAALYHRAELVVNTSLFEGGFPFTFSEGLSVGTPSVQAGLAETREFLGEELSREMLFDPFSPEDIAEVICWGLDNRQYLLEAQKRAVLRFKNNNWASVADSHIEIFKKVSSVH